MSADTRNPVATVALVPAAAVPARLPLPPLTSLAPVTARRQLSSRLLGGDGSPDDGDESPATSGTTAVAGVVTWLGRYELEALHPRGVWRGRWAALRDGSSGLDLVVQLGHESQAAAGAVAVGDMLAVTHAKVARLMADSRSLGHLHVRATGASQLFHWRLVFFPPPGCFFLACH